MLIGLSVSFCIRDIVEGKVDRKGVAYIIGSIDPTYKQRAADNDVSVGHGLSDIVEIYQRLYWYKEPEECKDLLYEMYGRGQILLPKMVANYNKIAMTLRITDGHWLECSPTDEPGKQDKISWLAW